MRTTELVTLTRNGRLDHCEIHPAWDGSGCYVIWVWPHAAGRGEGRVLSHEDGAPLRFRDAVRAHGLAMQCGLKAQEVTVRWPPTGPCTANVDDRRASRASVR